uniref:Replication initiation protein-like C-terminal domain-containing protein n=1 Tax=Johanseniella sp. A1345 TaxID=380087 RepID=A3F822_9NOST|nr:hypothetical protein [Johanseniella A1345]
MFAGIAWQSSVTSLDGLRCGYNQCDDGLIHAWVSLPGGMFHLADLRDAWRCLVGLRFSYNFKCTRIDGKLRDYSRRKTPTQIADEARAGNVARVKKYYQCGEGNVGQQSIDTCYLGSRKSEKFLRIYDAKPVHCIDAVDWELQCRDANADIFFQYLTDISNVESENRIECVARLIASAVLGAVEFIHRQEGVRLSRQQRQEWWEAMIDEAGGQIRFSIARQSVTVTRVLDWLQRQVITMMSALSQGLGVTNFNKWFESNMDRSVERFSRTHEALIQECRRYAASNADMYNPMQISIATS